MLRFYKRFKSLELSSSSNMIFLNYFGKLPNTFFFKYLFHPFPFPLLMELGGEKGISQLLWETTHPNGISYALCRY